MKFRLILQYLGGPKGPVVLESVPLEAEKADIEALGRVFRTVHTPDSIQIELVTEESKPAETAAPVPVALDPPPVEAPTA